MEVAASLGGVVVGALLALVLQWHNRQSEHAERNRLLMVEQCALLAGLEEDFRNRIWEERNDVASDVVAEWAIGDYRIAEAKIRILGGSKELITSLLEMREVGSKLGGAWRRGERNEAEIEAAWNRQRLAIDAFIAAAHEDVARS